MPTSAAPSALRAARAARGWSQAGAARELSALAHARGVPVAAAASLKTLLSRWENGHAVPEPQYRTLLGELFECSPAELDIDGAPDAGPTGADMLRAEIAAAVAVGAPTLELWWEQLAVVRRLDDELGAAGAGALVLAQVEQLERTLTHTLSAGGRRAVAAVLAAAAALAGTQALDRAEHADAWRRYERSRATAAEAELPVAGAVAVAGLAAVLVDAGEPDIALELLGTSPPAGPPAARIRWESARGLTRAAVADAAGARAAFHAAEQTLASAATPGPPLDLARAAQPVEAADVHRWHGRALVTLGDPAAVIPLERALTARPGSVRHRAGLHADLAAALVTARPEAAAEHARTARALAERIGSVRIAARLTGPRTTP